MSVSQSNEHGHIVEVGDDDDGGGGNGVDQDKQNHNTIKLEWLQCAVYDEFHHQSAVSANIL